MLSPRFPSVVTVPRTGDARIDALTLDLAYEADADGVTRISFSFPTTSSTFPGGFVVDGTDFLAGFVPILPEAADFLREGVEFISNIANIEFTEVADTGSQFGLIRLAGTTFTSPSFVGFAFFPFSSERAGNIILTASAANITSSSLQRLTLHELGHTLGLDHPGNNSAVLPAEFNGEEYTVLNPTFASAFFADAVSADLRASTFGYIDILALQSIYGINTAATAGDATYTFDLADRHFLTLYDLGGNDTIVISGSGGSVNIDLTPGTFIDVGTTITYFGAANQVLGTRSNTVYVTPETVIENVTAADGDDTLVGNDVSNVLRGNAGDDVLSGRLGADRVIGGLGSDTVSGGAGNDQLFAGAGDLGDDVVVGGSGDDTLGGAAGNDFLIGGGQSGIAGLAAGDSAPTDDGSDLIFGGSGNDTILGGGFNDLNGNGTYDDGEAVTTGTGNDIAFVGTGDDLVIGAAGNDEFGGGTGNDTVDAGAGNDTIYGGRGDVDGPGLNDVLTGGAGNDQIFASRGNDSVTGGTGDDELFGGSGDDTVSGGAGDDDVFGGPGNDILSGGTGSDRFGFPAGTGDDQITDFSVAEDELLLANTNTDFTDAASVAAAAANVAGGVLIDLGGGDSLLLTGLTVNDLANITYTF
ncbi:MAG: hypothetical protein JKY60_16160 [Kordiimonadaceae bacterium]|nr:hypothetical protein [Kordiimonadaceae bacterium]